MGKTEGFGRPRSDVPAEEKPPLPKGPPQMSNVTYDREQTRRLQPLLLSIGKEIRERSAVLSFLVGALDELDVSEAESPAREVRQMLTSEASTQRRELLRTKRELEELGCSLLRRSPVTIHIPGTEDGEDRTVIWRLRETKKGENEVEEIYIATQAARGR
jgi:hypothetical protein